MQARTEVKVLGIIFDEALSYRSHAEQVLEELAKRSGILLAALGRCPMISSKTGRVLYTAIVEFKVRYGVAVWAPVLAKKCAKLIKKIDAVIVRCCRAFLGLHGKSSVLITLDMADCKTVGELAEVSGFMLVDRAMRCENCVLGELIDECSVSGASAIRPTTPLGAHVTLHDSLLGEWEHRLERYISSSAASDNWLSSSVSILEGTVEDEQSAQRLYPGYDLVLAIDGSLDKDFFFGRYGPSGVGIVWARGGDVVREGHAYAGLAGSSYDVEIAASTLGLQQTRRCLHELLPPHWGQPRVLKLTDSQSQLSMLKKGRPDTERELRLVQELNRLGSEVSLHIGHARGHAGVYVNERADARAAAGRCCAEASPDDPIVVTPSAAKSVVEGHVRSRRADLLEESCKSNVAVYLDCGGGRSSSRYGVSDAPRHLQRLVNQVRAGGCTHIFSDIGRDSGDGSLWRDFYNGTAPCKLCGRVSSDLVAATRHFVYCVQRWCRYDATVGPRLFFRSCRRSHALGVLLSCSGGGGDNQSYDCVWCPVSSILSASSAVDHGCPWWPTSVVVFLLLRHSFLSVHIVVTDPLCDEAVKPLMLNLRTACGVVRGCLAPGLCGAGLCSGGVVVVVPFRRRFFLELFIALCILPVVAVGCGRMRIVSTMLRRLWL